MGVLLDECVPRALRNDLPGHEVKTVAELGWAGVKNGELLRRAAAEFDLLITVDRNLEYQQSFEGLSLAVIVVHASSNDITILRRPRLVERTMCSGNHPGPMKVLTRSRYTAAQNGSGWARSDRQPLCRGWPSAAEHSFRNTPTIIDLAMTRVGKGARRAHAARHYIFI